MNTHTVCTFSVCIGTFWCNYYGPSLTENAVRAICIKNIGLELQCMGILEGKQTTQFTKNLRILNHC